MSFELHDEDRQAVDLLLDQVAESRDQDQAFAKPAANGRVAAASNLLSMLDHMPAEEPPADLVRKTLMKIDKTFVTSGPQISLPDQPQA